jgi:hypothetical protein
MSNQRSPLDQPQFPFSGPGVPYAPAQGGAPASAYPYGYGAPGPNGYGPGQYPQGQYPQGTYAPPPPQNPMMGASGNGQPQPVRQQGPGNPMAYPQGNTFQDQFLAERTPGEMSRLDALSRQAAEQLGPQTILRPFIVPKKITNISLNNEDPTDDQNAEFTLEYYFPFATFIRKITATLTDPVLNDAFNANLLATASPFANDISALDYIEGKLERANNENIFTDYAPLSEWCGNGQLSYVWDLIPYISRAETIRINCRIPKVVPQAGGSALYYYDYISAVNITLHCMRFPAP